MEELFNTAVIWAYQDTLHTVAGMVSFVLIVASIFTWLGGQFKGRHSKA